MPKYCQNEAQITVFIICLDLQKNSCLYIGRDTKKIELRKSKILLPASIAVAGANSTTPVYSTFKPVSIDISLKYDFLSNAIQIIFEYIYVLSNLTLVITIIFHLPLCRKITVAVFLIDVS